MARPRKPDHIKKAQGTLRECRVNQSPATAEILSAVPAVPDDVPDDGRGYFVQSCEILFSLGVLTAAYIPDISRVAMWYSIFIRAFRAIEADGYFQTTQGGYTAINAHLTTMDKAHKHLVDFEGRYGLTLVSAQKISIPAKPKNEKDFD